MDERLFKICQQYTVTWYSDGFKIFQRGSISLSPQGETGMGLGEVATSPISTR